MALTAQDFTNISASLERRHLKDHVGSFFDEESDGFMAYLMDEKASDNGGLGFQFTMVGNGTITNNPTLAEAGGRALYSQFQVPAVTDNWQASWTLDAMDAAATKGLQNAYDLAKETMDLHKAEMKRKLTIYFGGKGWGSLAGIQAVTTGTAGFIILGHPDGTSAAIVAELANRFQVGLRYKAADAEHTGAFRAEDGADLPALCTAINEQTGRVDFDDVSTNWAVGDYVSQVGYRHATAAKRRTFVGLEGYLDPVAAISGDSLGAGSDTRYLRPDLQPRRFDCAGKDVEDALIELDGFAHHSGMTRKGLRIFVNSKVIQELSKGENAKRVVQLETKRPGGDGKSVVTIGYSAFMIQGATGKSIEVIGSSRVRPGLVFYGPFGDAKMGFKLLYSGEAIINHTRDASGGIFQVAENGVADGTGELVQGYIAKGRIRAQVVCRHPGNYVVGTGLGA
jgi:hypothetical protein